MCANLKEMSATLTTAPEQAAPASFTGQSPWIYRPWVDLLIGCGAWSAPLLLISFYATNSYSRAWTVAFYFLALLFNYPHFMATVYRAYHTQTEFQKYRIFTVHVALLLVLAGLAAHLWYPLLPWIFTLYICWSPWHYTGQNFGLLMMFARRSGLAPSTAERNAIYLSFIASFVMLMLSFHTGASGDALILSLGLPVRFTLPARAVLAFLFVGATGWALWSMARRSGLRAIVAPLTLAITQFFWFLLPAIIELYSGRDIPQTRYSSGILAVLHSTQYLWITSYYQEREARASGDLRWKFSRYLVTLVAGGIALFIPGPWIVSRVFHADFAASFLTFTALVNIHHFILDGALWKLRDSRVARFLLGTEGSSRGTMENTQSAFQAATGWLTGPAGAARFLRISTAVVLFAWAAIDQLHFYWFTKADDLPALERAAKLNPDDSSIQARLARASALAGNREVSLAALQRAAGLRSGDFSQQEAYARGLIEAGRNTEAYAQYQRILERWPRNANALVNFGVLAQKMGEDGQAIDSWQSALTVDPAQPNPQLYLAQTLDRRGNVEGAARHYRAYLQIVAAHPKEHTNEVSTVLAALIKVADWDASSNQLSDAFKGYQAAIQFAARANDKTLECLALVHLADLEEKQKNAAIAAQAYQHALALDAALGDPVSAASDWLNYGKFLHENSLPERFVLACFLHAEELVKTKPGPVLTATVQARAESETRLGHGAAEVRRSVEAIAKEALALPAESFSKPH